VELRQASDLELWDSRIALVSEYPIFQNVKGRLIISEKAETMFSDALRIMSMVHVPLRARPHPAPR
jgi:hypothetical protein